MGLFQYRKKRDFSKTPEPNGGGKKTKVDSTLFIIQKHAASHLHYDFRLALGGTLKSWAVPKGPSLDPSVKRLAIHVEDHPLAYGSFEGIIPKGQYGGGIVMLWDKGTWKSLDENPHEAYKNGHLRFELTAKKLKGRWDLIRFKDDKHWFLVKHQDKYARPLEKYDITHEKPDSVISQYNLAEIEKYYQYVWTRKGLQSTASNKKNTNRIKKSLKFKQNLKPKQSDSSKKPILNKLKIPLLKGLVTSDFPEFIPPQLATLVNKVPEKGDWIHEIKFDGYRIIAYKQGKNVILKSRNNKNWTEAFLSIAEAIKQLPIKSCIFDGEVVVLDNEGRSNFQLLQNSLEGESNKPFLYYLFDCLYCNGYDLRKLTLLKRKSILKVLLENNIPALLYSDHIIKTGDALYSYACEHGLEGIVSKMSDSPYVSKRSQSWLKIKCSKRQEFVIGGYTAPMGSRLYFGSLFLGVYDNRGQLKFSGNVGTGFNTDLLKNIKKKLISYACDSNPFNTKPPGASRAQWVEPVLVCEVEFTDWTKDGRLRHPSFKGMRLDKEARDVIREVDNKKIKSSQETKKVEQYSTSFIPSNKEKKSDSPAVIISHPDKILYPEDKITKKDLLQYYEIVADWILPYITERPLTLIRCPSTYKDCFYQRHHLTSMHKTLLPIEDNVVHSQEHYIYLKNKEGLFNLVQLGALEIHPWGSKITHLEKPDILIFDLDPAPDVRWSTVVSAAKSIGDYFSEYDLDCFVKSTGGKGLHVLLPILPEYDWPEVKEFSHVFASLLERLHPERFISKMSKSKRQGKIFLDYLRNQRTATAIAPYSTRARIHAPVSTPLFWDELSNCKKDNIFTIKTLPRRLSDLKGDPWETFWKIKQSLRLDKL